MRFVNKVAVVTGGGSGIGKEVARRFVAEGGSVLINGRDEAKLAAAAAEIDPSGRRVAVHAGDIADPQTGRALADAAIQRFGQVDALFNNAGVFRPKPFLELDEQDFDWFLDTILKGKFFAAQAAAAAMIGRGGAIVQTGSMWALQAVGATPSAAYSAANAGVHALVRNLAIELAPHGIRVNAVAPGVVSAAAGIGDAATIASKASPIIRPIARSYSLRRHARPSRRRRQPLDGQWIGPSQPPMLDGWRKGRGTSATRLPGGRRCARSRNCATS